MSSIGSLNGAGLLGSGAARGSLSLRAPRRRNEPAIDAQRRFDLQRFDDGLRTLRRDLDRLDRTRDVLTRFERSEARDAGPAAAISTAALGLTAQATATTLRSTAEVNTTPTSFTPFGPTVSGATTSLPSVGGTYDGAQGDDVLSFQFRDNAVVGSSDRLRVRVRDGAGNVIDNLNFRNQPVGFTRTLSNGLGLSLGAGSTVKNDTFQVSVSTTTGSAVDPSQPFDGTRNQNPNFEAGTSVGAGTFEVNGAVISVAANDSIDSVLAKITASAAGVDASFDASSEAVVLTQRTLGSAAHISVANDTSGFLAATKLAAAGEVLGQDGDPTAQPIADVPELAGVADGQLSINGVAISVTIATDSLGDVLDRINASAAGVTATLDPQSQRVSITSDDPAASLVLSGDSSGLLSDLRIAQGTYAPRAAEAERFEKTRVFEAPESLTSDLRQLRRSLNALFSGSFSAIPDDELGSLRERLVDALTDSFESLSHEEVGKRFRSGLGLDFDLEPRSGKLLAIDSSRLRRSLANDADALARLLFSEEEDGERGIVPVLSARLGTLQTLMDARLGNDDERGALVDLKV